MITRLTPHDVTSGFHSGTHALDDYFVRHALGNDQRGISLAYVLRQTADDAPELPAVLGFYTLSMAQVVPAAGSVPLLVGKLPRYPLPVALLGRLAVDQRAQGHRLGEKLLIDALRRVATAATTLGCIGAIVDAKEERAQRFYERYGFVPLEQEAWPRRLFLSISVISGLFAEGEESRLAAQTLTLG